MDSSDSLIGSTSMAIGIGSSSSELLNPSAIGGGGSGGPARVAAEWQEGRAFGVEGPDEPGESGAGGTGGDGATTAAAVRPFVVAELMALAADGFGPSLRRDDAAPPTSDVWGVGSVVLTCGEAVNGVRACSEATAAF